MLSDERSQQEAAMKSPGGSVDLVLGGVPSPNALDHVRRYCGLPWSGSPPETWAYRYFDAIETDSDRLDPIDVVSAAALHPGVSRADLAFFHDRRSEIDSWLHRIPCELQLAHSDGDGALDELIDFEPPSFTLFTKVLHRKRPGFVPMVDRHALDRYRPITGERQALRAWPALAHALRADLQRNEVQLAALSTTIEVELGHRVSWLRLCDIVIWMDARP